MPVQLTSFIVPKNNASWYLLEDTYLKGGMRVVPDVSSLSLINTANLKSGMLVVTGDTGNLWQLASDLVTWQPRLFANVSSNSSSCYTHVQSTPAVNWYVNHGTGYKYFSYTAFDDTGLQIMPNQMQMLNNNQAQLSFNTPVSGSCTMVFNTSL